MESIKHHIKAMAQSHVMSSNHAATISHINDPKIRLILSPTCRNAIGHAINNLVTQNIANHNGNMEEREIIRRTDQSSNDSGVLACRPKSPSKSLLATHQRGNDRQNGSPQSTSCRMNGKLRETLLNVHAQHSYNKTLAMMQQRGSSSAHVVPTKIKIHLRRQDLMPKLIQRIEFVESTMSVPKMIHCNWQWRWHHSQCCQMATKFPIPINLNPSTLASSHPSEKWS